MRNLITNWPLSPDQFENKPLALFLDFDGTLAPIADTPTKAVLIPQNKILLQKLSQISNYHITIVSERSLQDLKSKVNIPNIIYIGNHGLEMEWGLITFESFIPHYAKEAIQRIKGELLRRLSLIKGVIVEDKKLTLSLHYRLVNDADVHELKTIFFEVCRHYLAEEKILICNGKHVLEVRPFAPWEKTNALAWIMKKHQESEKKNIFPIYIGDDKTDEETFVQLKNIGGLTIVVGKQNSHAEYYVNDTSEVTWVLEAILKLSRKRAESLQLNNAR